MADQNAPLITLSQAGLYRNGHWLVRGLDLTLERREIVTLIGPNGSGKSTTAKLALGIHTPDEGHVERQRSARIGYVPQKLSIDWTMPLTVARFMQLTDRLPKVQVETALSRTGVSHLARSDMRTLSGGETQRVLLARAIAQKPDILVLDEPAQGVDFAGEIALYELIRAVRDELDCGILMVSHDLHLVMAATDRVICLNGHICCQGSPTSVAEAPEYRQLFGRQAADILAVYRHQHDHEHLPDGRVRHADGSITDHCHPDDGHHQTQCAQDIGAERENRGDTRHAG